MKYPALISAILAVAWLLLGWVIIAKAQEGPHAYRCVFTIREGGGRIDPPFPIELGYDPQRGRGFWNDLAEHGDVLVQSDGHRLTFLNLDDDSFLTIFRNARWQGTPQNAVMSVHWQENGQIRAGTFLGHCEKHDRNR